MNTQLTVDENRVTNFTVSIHADSVFRKSEDSFILEVSVTALSGPFPVGDKLTSRTVVPISEFKNEHDANRWAEDVLLFLRAHIQESLAHEAVLLASDEAAAAINIRGHGEQVDMEETLRKHERSTAERLRSIFNIKKTGPAAQWSNSELQEALAVLSKEMEGIRWTYTTVAEKLKESYGSKAPESGEALRKMLKRLHIKWTELKAGRFTTVDKDRIS